MQNSKEGKYLLYQIVLFFFIFLSLLLSFLIKGKEEKIRFLRAEISRNQTELFDRSYLVNELFQNQKQNLQNAIFSPRIFNHNINTNSNCDYLVVLYLGKGSCNSCSREQVENILRDYEDFNCFFVFYHESNSAYIKEYLDNGFISINKSIALNSNNSTNLFSGLMLLDKNNFVRHTISLELFKLNIDFYDLVLNQFIKNDNFK